MGFHLGTVYIGNPTVADHLAFFSQFKHDLQLMFGEAGDYSGQNRYQIHPVKIQVASLANPVVGENLVWTLNDNELSLTDSTVHRGLIRAGRKESELNVQNRISLAR